MSKALKKAVRELFLEAKTASSAMKRLLNPSTDNSFAGSRIYPAQNAKKDMKYGVRFDRGQSVTGQPNLVVMNLQINTNPQAKSLKALVRKHTPHRKYVTIKVDTTQAATEENLDKLLDEVESKIDALNDL